MSYHFTQWTELLLECNLTHFNLSNDLKYTKTFDSLEPVYLTNRAESNILQIKLDTICNGDNLVITNNDLNRIQKRFIHKFKFP